MLNMTGGSAVRKRTPISLGKALRLTNILFYGGLGLAVVIYFACQSTLWQERDFPSLLAALAVLGLLGVLAGLGVAFAALRGPHCGASLMAGGRIPGRLPRFCPDCGKPVDGRISDKE